MQLSSKYQGKYPGDIRTFMINIETRRINTHETEIMMKSEGAVRRMPGSLLSAFILNSVLRHRSGNVQGVFRSEMFRARCSESDVQVCTNERAIVYLVQSLARRCVFHFFDCNLRVSPATTPKPFWYPLHFGIFHSDIFHSGILHIKTPLHFNIAAQPFSIFAASILGAKVFFLFG